MAKRKKRGKENKKTDDNDGDGGNCSEYIALLQKDKREKIQKKRTFILQEMTNVCSKNKKCVNGNGNSKVASVCVRAFSRLCFTFVQLFTVFFFQIDYVNIGM